MKWIKIDTLLMMAGLIAGIAGQAQPCPPNNHNGGIQDKPRRPGSPGNRDSTSGVRANDPNEIIGPDGYSDPKWVSGFGAMPYTVFFENNSAASAPAKAVRVEYPIDAKQDENTFSLGSFGFNSLSFSVPPNTPAFYQRVNALDSLGLYVDVTAGLDVVNHKAFWLFQSIDPTTLLPPSDPLKGFLLLPDSTKPTAGHGFVNFSIKPLSADVTGDTTHAMGNVYFDANDVLATNSTTNTVDAVAPTSHMHTPQVNGSLVKLSWDGADDPNASGLKYWTLYVSANGADYSVVQTGLTGTDTTITGIAGNTYRYFVLGTDNVGNVEALRSGAEVSAFVGGENLPVKWLSFSGVLHGKDALLTWTVQPDASTASFGVERSLDATHFADIGEVAAESWQSMYSYTDANVAALDANTVYYRIREVSKDGANTWSTIVAVGLPGAGNQPLVKLYPNPFHTSLSLLIVNVGEVRKGDEAIIYTRDGKAVYRKSIGSRMPNTTVTLNDLPASMSAGAYVLELVLDGKKYSYPILRN